MVGSQHVMCEAENHSIVDAKMAIANLLQDLVNCSRVKLTGQLLFKVNVIFLSQ